MADRGASDEQIARALKRLVEGGAAAGTHVIVAQTRRPYYVQFRVDGDVLWCEAVHNKHLAPEDRLDRSQIRQLKRLGWAEPRRPDQNYRRSFAPERPEDYREIARVVRQAFAAAYRLPPGGTLSLRYSFAEPTPSRRAPAGRADDGRPEAGRLWLKYFLADRRSGDVLVEWEAERLPPELQVAQLPSFLTQRFGTPLRPWDGRGGGAAFRPPAGIGPARAVLVAVPLIVGDDGQLRPVAERLHELGQAFAELALDPLGALTLDELWVGPLVESDAVSQPVNDAAARASRAWLVGLGLVQLIESAAARDPEPRPLPGKDALSAALEDAVQGAVAAAEEAVALCWTLASPVRQRAGGHGSSVAAHAQADERSLVRHHLAAGVAAREAERITRALAQLAFGVSAGSASSPEIERLDRAAVAALHPPEGHGPRAGLALDGLAFRSATRDELVVEIAGLLARLLFERRARVRLRVARDRPDLVVEVSPDDALLVRLDGPLPDLLRAALARAGWPAARTKPAAPKPLLHRWPSPVTLMVPARLVVRTLYDGLGLAKPARLRASARDA
jgi:hypothetical protein